MIKSPPLARFFCSAAILLVLGLGCRRQEASTVEPPGSDSNGPSSAQGRLVRGEPGEEESGEHESIDWSSRLPMGQWIDESNYVNDLVTPLRVKLPPIWRREPPPDAPGLHVLHRDGRIITDPQSEMEPAQVTRAFVVWAVLDDARGERTCLGIELHAIPPSQSFADFVDAEVERRVRDYQEQEAFPLDPLVRTSETWFEGRRCRQFDFDGFFPSSSFSTREVFVEAGSHAVHVRWLFSDPRTRVAVAELMKDIVELGPPLTPERKAERKALTLHANIRHAMTEAAREPSVDKLLSELREEELTQVTLIQRTASAYKERFTRVGTPARFAAFSDALASRSTAEELQAKITNLRVLCDVRWIETAWSRLSSEDQKLARRFRPDFVLAGYGPSDADWATTGEHRPPSPEKWLAFQFPGSEFRVDMPAQPTQQQDGSFNVTIQDSGATVAFMVLGSGGEHDFQPDNRALVGGLLAGLLPRLTRNRITLIRIMPLRFRGDPGYQVAWSFESDGKPMMGFARMFFTRHGIAVLMVQRPADSKLDSLEDAFLQSLRLEQ
jgi:hypothetical protein